MSATLQDISAKLRVVTIAWEAWHSAAVMIRPSRAATALESARRRSTFLANRARTFSVLRPLPDLVKEINEFQPTVLEGYPSALALLANEQQAERLTIQPLMAITAGEQ